MRRLSFSLSLFFLLSATSLGQNITVHPVGVNVNPNTGSTAFLTYGKLSAQMRPAEAVWCGELTPAAPDLGLRCDPGTIFGTLPARYNLSKASGTLGFTDIMSIPPSVARRAYQAAAAGAESRFFYVRRFVNTAGGPDEFVIVTCRLAGGGARTPFALTDVQIGFEPEQLILFLQPDQSLPKFTARIAYNGTGRLKGRWEVVLPGDELPTEFDLLPEGSLPIAERGQQKRYFQAGRFNVFLPPTGKFTLEGPDPMRLPRRVEGSYQILLRIEASDDKETDSDLAAVGAGLGIVHSGALAGFALPTLRYVVGSAISPNLTPLVLLGPAENATLAASTPLQISWAENQSCSFVRVEFSDASQRLLLSALLPAGVKTYRAPSFLNKKTPDGSIRWRILSFDARGNELYATPWRSGLFARNF